MTSEDNSELLSAIFEPFFTWVIFFSSSHPACLVYTQTIIHLAIHLNFGEL